MSLSDEDIQNLQDWGVTLIRLGVMWEAVERTPGVYDDAYLVKIEEIVKRLGEKGIYTMIDAH
jgi:endoglycosylceramidase